VRLLLTRPEPDAERTAAALRARGHTITLAPLLRIEAIADVPLGAGPWAAIVVTSASAARAIKLHPSFDLLRALKVLAIGDRSAQEMRNVGFADVTSAGGEVSDLSRLIGKRMQPDAPLLYLAGEDRAGDLAEGLRGLGFTVQIAVIYRAVVAAALPKIAIDALAGGIDGVLHFSRRSAEAYIDLAGEAGSLASALKPVQFCLSAAIAEPLTRAGAGMIRVAASPTETALLVLIGSQSSPP
jgi:uroporphyrinogen-III synthase